MTETLERELDRIFRTLRIDSAAAFSFRGGPPMMVPPVSVHRGFVIHSADLENLVVHLQGFLYQLCYALRRPDLSLLSGPSGSDAAFLSRLSAANSGRDRWESGWRIFQLGELGWVLAGRGLARQWVAPGRYRGQGADSKVSVGDLIQLRIPRESSQILPDFYIAFGEQDSPRFDRQPRVRFYFHVRDQDAAGLITHFTRTLNQLRIPFRFKCRSHPLAFVRADAALLLVGRKDIEKVAETVHGLPDRIKSRLIDRVPLFSFPFMPGVGVADDPPGGGSFGLSRCRLLAEALVEAWVLGSQSPENRRKALARRFQAHGLSLQTPHLNPGTSHWNLPA